MKLLRWEPLADRFVVVRPRQEGPWYLARTTGPKGHPLEIFTSYGYATLAQAHWALFRKRWEQHTGQPLVLDNDEDRVIQPATVESSPAGVEVSRCLATPTHSASRTATPLPSK